MRSQVAIARCPDYDPARVSEAVARAVGLLGGIGRFVTPGERILVKPNLLSALPPERAVTTHPAVVEAVIGLLQSAGADVSLGDSPPLAGEKEASYRRLLDVTGMTGVAERTGARIVRFEEASVEVPQPDGRYFRSFQIAREVVAANALISVPKLKTHGLTYLSGAVKNLFGCVPGRRKALFHAQAGDDRETFAQMLVDLVGVARPRLSIVDAITAMDGDGPVNGRVRNVGLILAGTDPVALDAVASAIFGFDPLSVHTTRLASEQRVGVADLANIEVLGERIEDVLCPGFVEPRFGDMWTRMPRPVRKLLKNQLIPFPSVAQNCRDCGSCVDACPVGTIHRRGDHPEVDLDRCIRCYCCREVCEYGAMDLRIGRLSAAVRAARDLGRAVRRVFGDER